MLGLAALNIYVSEVDAAVYARLFSRRRTAVVPNGVDTTYFAPMPVAPEAAYMVFEGNMNFEPNVDTAEVLVHEILPRLVHAGSARTHRAGRPEPDRRSSRAGVRQG